ncbi:MAG: NAD(P)H-dependent glycerol-3-phosphate dehydrogenase [Tetrasphaera sp.]
MKVTVLGGGNWGTTVASITARRHDVVLWARSEEVVAEVGERHTNSRYLDGFTLHPKLRATADLQQAVEHAELLIVGVPTGAVRATVAAAREHLHPWIPIVSLAKGFEQDSLLRMTEVIHHELPSHPVAALTGPNIAREIMAGQAAASVIATPDLAVAKALQRVLSTGLFRVYTNPDVIGCELGGALKNVVAIACGMAEGLGVGDNTRALVMTRGLAELIRLGEAMGGQGSSFAGLAGMGDLIATCLSPMSRNRSVGEKLGRGLSIDEITGGMTMVAEGIKTAVTAHELAERFGIGMPIHETIYGVVTGAIDPLAAYRGLGPRPGGEDEPG